MTAPRTKNPADIGGEEAGPIDTVDHGLKFWEKQANALRNTLTRRKIVRLDELRRAAEDLGQRYYELAYGFDGEPRRVLYRVRFRQKEVWDGYEGPDADWIEMEIYEHWLEPA
jgi:hypothetical protein